MKPDKPSECVTCKRAVALSFHHLVPKKMHDKPVARIKHPDKELIHYGEWLCKDCHKKVHKLFSHNDLADHYFTIEALMRNEKFAKFVAWVSKQKKRVK